MNFKQLENEKILKEGKSNRNRLFFSQGGNLALTNKRIVFVGHGANIGEGTISINLEDILTYGKAFTFILLFPLPIPNAIKIVTTDGKKYAFSVYGRKEWVAKLRQACTN